MIRKLFKHTGKISFLIFEGLAILCALVVIIGAIFVWRLTTGPLSLDFATKYVEQALSENDSGYEITTSGLVVEWPDLKGPLILTLEGVKISQNATPLLSIGSIDLGLARTPLLRGDVKPEKIIIGEPSLFFTRTKNGSISFNITEIEGFENNRESPENSETTTQEILETLLLSEDKNYDNPASYLKNITINDANMVIADYKLGITWYVPNLDIIFAKDTEGLAISSEIIIAGGKNGDAQINLNAVYNSENKNIKAQTNITNLDPRIVARHVDALKPLAKQSILINGEINTLLDANLNPQIVTLDISSSVGSLLLDELYYEQLAYDEISLKAKYSNQTNIIDIEKLTVSAGGLTLNVETEIPTDKENFEIPIKASIPVWSQENIMVLWPDTVKDLSLETWLKERLYDGRVENTEATATIKVTKDEETEERTIDIADLKADFDIVDMTVDYTAPLWPLTKTNAKGHIEDDVMTIDVAEGYLKTLNAGGSKIKITNLTSDDVGQAIINAKIKGSIPDVFGYISNEPIGMASEELGLSVDNLKGETNLNVDVSFPTLKDLPKEQVKVVVDGTLNNVLIPDVLETLDLSGGPFRLSVKNAVVTLKGDGFLDERPIDLQWQENIDADDKPYQTQIIAKITADDYLKDKLDLRDLDDWLVGDYPLDVTYTEYKDNRAVADIRANIKSATLMLSPFKYTKNPGTEGTVTTQLLFAGGYLQEIDNLNVTTPDIKINNGRLIFETQKGEPVLTQGQIDRFLYNETDVKIDFETSTSDLVKLRVNGPFLDAQPFLGKDKDEKKTSKDPYDGPPVIASVDVERMRTHETRLIESAKVYLDLGRDGLPNQLELDANVGQGNVYLRLKPDNNGIMNLRFETNDAGATLRAFDIYETISGGTLIFDGRAKVPNSKNIIIGNAELRDFKITKAPTLAKIINAIGLASLPQMLSNEGIYFSRLESEFEWNLRPEGDLYIIQNGRTRGSSIGLTFDGRVDKATSSINIAGHVIPVSGLNSLISDIPLVGDILTGGSDGGIFAATYTIKGNDSAPKVSVNPLSALTPGILRRILFEPNDPNKKADKKNKDIEEKRERAGTNE